MKLLFLGCAGGRRITFQQKRASGGFIVYNHNTTIHVDPGPGALVRLIQVGIDPSNIDTFILTHRHLDHSADINTLIEARTMGGWNPGGTLIAPEDALKGEDPVVLKYHRKHLRDIKVLKEDFSLKGSITVKAGIKHIHHGVETYGLIFEDSKKRISYITDGKFQEEMIEAYAGSDVLIINTTFKKPRDLDHLCLEDAIKLAKAIKPHLVILNHFGAEIVFWGLDRAAEYVESHVKTKTVSAREFMGIDLDNLELYRHKLVNPIGLSVKKLNNKLNNP